jgi:hypothetical protein
MIEQSQPVSKAEFLPEITYTPTQSEVLSEGRQTIDLITTDLTLNKNESTRVERTLNLRIAYNQFYSLCREIIRQRKADIYIKAGEKMELEGVYASLVQIDNQGLYTQEAADKVYDFCLKILYQQNNWVPQIMRRIL